MSNNILSIQKKFVILHRLSTDRKTERKRVSLIPWIVNLDTSLKHKVGIRLMDFSLVLYSYSYDILQVGLFKEPYLLYAKWESKPNYPR